MTDCKHPKLKLQAIGPISWYKCESCGDKFKTELKPRFRASFGNPVDVPASVRDLAKAEVAEGLYDKVPVDVPGKESV